MSTRCNIIVSDKHDVIVLYRHSDGYPDDEHGVIRTLNKALPLAWSKPRYEADEFAAAIVAAWKTSPGGIRIRGAYQKHEDEKEDNKWKDYLNDDIDYYYLIEKSDNNLVIKVYECGFGTNDQLTSKLVQTVNLW